MPAPFTGMTVTRFTRSTPILPTFSARYMIWSAFIPGIKTVFTFTAQYFLKSFLLQPGFLSTFLRYRHQMILYHRNSPVLFNRPVTAWLGIMSNGNLKKKVQLFREIPEEGHLKRNKYIFSFSWYKRKIEISYRLKKIYRHSGNRI